MSTSSESTALPASGSPIEKIATGIRGLDEILFGGLPAGRTTLVTGGPGTGKTVMGMELLYRGALEERPGLLISFEERVEDLRTNAASMGMDVAELEAGGALRIVRGEVPHHAVRAGEFDIQGLLAIVDGHLRDLGAHCVVFDAIDVLMRVFGNPQREREELYILQSWLQERNLTAILTLKAGPEVGRIYPFLDFLADCVLMLDQRMDRQVRTRRLTVVKCRGSSFLGNEHPYVLSPEGIVLMPISSLSLVAQVSEERVSSGVATLDKILGGGYFLGTCVLVAGPSGSGKTTLAAGFADAACRRGEPVLYVNFEEPPQGMISELRSAGIDLQPRIDVGTLNVLAAMPEFAGTEEHLLRVYQAIDRFDPRHVVVDAISACRRMGSQQAAFDFLVRLVTTCRRRGITCLYVSQTDEPAWALEVSGQGISSLVDTAVALQFADDDKRLGRRLVVIKSRGTSHSLAYHAFRITDRGIELDDATTSTGNEG